MGALKAVLTSCSRRSEQREASHAWRADGGLPIPGSPTCERELSGQVASLSGASAPPHWNRASASDANPLHVQLELTLNGQDYLIAAPQLATLSTTSTRSRESSRRQPFVRGVVAMSVSCVSDMPYTAGAIRKETLQLHRFDDPQPDRRRNRSHDENDDEQGPRMPSWPARAARAHAGPSMRQALHRARRERLFSRSVPPSTSRNEVAVREQAMIEAAIMERLLKRPCRIRWFPSFAASPRLPAHA